MMQTIHSCEVRRKVVNIMGSEERPKLPVNSLVGALNLIEAILNEMMDEYALPLQNCKSVRMTELRKTRLMRWKIGSAQKRLCR